MRTHSFQFEIHIDKNIILTIKTICHILTDITRLFNTFGLMGAEVIHAKLTMHLLLETHVKL